MKNPVVFEEAVEHALKFLTKNNILYHHDDRTHGHRVACVQEIAGEAIFGADVCVESYPVRSISEHDLWQVRRCLQRGMAASVWETTGKKPRLPGQRRTASAGRRTRRKSIPDGAVKQAARRILYENTLAHGNNKTHAHRLRRVVTSAENKMFGTQITVDAYRVKSLAYNAMWSPRGLLAAAVGAAGRELG